MRDPTYDPRAAGQITRYHTWPRLREQSVGEHTWQVMRILLIVWPDCPRKILHYAVFHDVDEMAGDIPYPFKKDVPELGRGMKIAGSRVLAKMREAWSVATIPTLSEYENRVFKICENIEMWEWGLFEQALGNQFGAIVAQRMFVAASDLMAHMTIPAGYPDIRPAITRYIQRRIENEQSQHASPELSREGGEGRRGVGPR